MGHLHLSYFEDDKVYVCRSCNTHLSTPDHIISKVRGMYFNLSFHTFYSASALRATAESCFAYAVTKSGAWDKRLEAKP